MATSLAMSQFVIKKEVTTAVQVGQLEKPCRCRHVISSHPLVHAAKTPCRQLQYVKGTSATQLDDVAAVDNIGTQ